MDMNDWGNRNRLDLSNYKFGAIDGAVVGMVLCAVISKKFGWSPTFATIGICAAAGGLAGFLLRGYLDDAEKQANLDDFNGKPAAPPTDRKPLPQILPPDDN